MKWPDFSELGQRLKIGAGDRVALINAPSGYEHVIPGVDGSAPDRADVVIGFIAGRGDLDLFSALYDAVLAGGRGWLAYPKPGRSQVDLHVHRDWLAREVRRYGVQSMVHVSIDESWSALDVEAIALDGDEAALAEADLAWPV
ncbi:hypothetical protein [Mycobacterium sp. HUMS_1102779]|uniref:hypothetical protein n=1 Tax=Mycobacterium sp. HUMS_1102779 TaxID=3383487 RepID=UPI00389AE80B